MITIRSSTAVTPGADQAHGPACSELILTTPEAASDPQQADQQVVSYLQAHPGIASRLLAQLLGACHDLSAGR